MTDRLTAEDRQYIDELSKDLLGRYKEQASRSFDLAAGIHNRTPVHGKLASRFLRKMTNRDAGIDRADKKLRESSDINEISKSWVHKKLYRAVDKAEKQNLGRNKLGWIQKRAGHIKDRFASHPGDDTHQDSVGWSRLSRGVYREGVEPAGAQGLNEISKKLAYRYAYAANAAHGLQSRFADEAARKADGAETKQVISGKDHNAGKLRAYATRINRKAYNRKSGIDRALKILARD